MDYFDVLKKAWRITWRYKALWILGLFAGAGSGGSSGGSSNYSTGSEQYTGSTDAFSDWMASNWVVFAVVIGILFLVGILFWVLSVAAQGGLVYGVNEAAEERAPSLRAAWGVGFQHWGRTFMISFVLGLPVLVLVLIAGAIAIGIGVGGFAIGDEAGGLAAVGGICLLLPLFVVLVVALSVAIGIIYPLALRYGVLQNITFGEAIKRGWYDLRAKRGAFVFWLVMLLPGFAFGAVILVLLVPFFVPAIAFAVGEKYVMAVGLLVLGSLVMLVPTAVYGTFISAAWTVFFRKMNGMESQPTAGYVPAAPAGYAAPAPPIFDAPPAPPATARITDAEANTPLREADPIAPPALPADAEEAPPSDE